ncbi:class I SAM-dependent methyltransferase [Pseudonocardia lacus]|uniref:class I SAM-dependent methyltransferase n=1 Tax=Pseudonocardia lacus TaxID=2835865 RepID=UPI0027E23CC6|nr:class I SAM-dependent methyltransferase [Pseudonocardia lacus]
MTASLTAAPTTTAFDAVLRGAPARMLRSDGVEVALDARRWRAPASGADRWLLDRCTGPAIDLGCGPGRLVAALVERGVPALGVDVSDVARRQCRVRRAPMTHRDVFAALPAEGRWDHVLLADGNIGIGGDPARLLRRAAELLRPGGSALVETDPRADLLWRGTVRVRTPHGSGPAQPWACAGADALAALAGPVGLVRTAAHVGARCFVELRSVGVGS